ncbi:MAG TPA: ABC transporter permease subunit, partial [Flavilitoribacter sp.]|nr:ABC transporter permease subunit [Flavilitoribacter sp.]
FLAFGILVYLLPVVVQRIDEVEDVYIKTVFTLGAKTWQTIRSVYLPSVMSRLIDDIRVLTAISWTYIIIAELLNRQGGLGGLIYLKQRQGQVDKLFAILIIIVAIGYIQDRLFVYFDKRLFPHKYYKSALKGLTEVEYGLLIFFGSLALAILLPAFIPALAGKLGVPVLLVVITSVILILFGEFKIQKNYVEQD